MDPKISIIVPVYKVEKYLRRCLDSIVNQTFTDWECILVDDGSPDDSGKICDEYAEKDRRFKIIHQENQGVSAARQKGLDNCIGEYVIHTDPDDWVESKYLEELFNCIVSENADMVICDFERIYQHKTKKYSQKPTSLNHNDIICDILEDKLWGILWNKLIKRECFIKYNLRFIKTMSLWEDMYIICSLLLNDIKVAYLPKVLYHYDTSANPNSILNCRKKNHIDSAITCINELSQKLTDSKFDRGLFVRKGDVKKMIFIIPNSGYSIGNTYSEINKKYVTKFRIGCILRAPTDYVVALYIRGHKFIAKHLYSLLHRIIIILSTIFR